MKTYIVESWTGELIEYFKTLNGAKRYVEEHSPTSTIIMARGQYFGEGSHEYALVYGQKKQWPYHGFKRITWDQYKNNFKNRVEKFGNIRGAK